MSLNPLERGPKPPQPAQKQPVPGLESNMTPRPDYGESTYKGSGKLIGKTAVITGGDSGIGRAVALAYAREGADVLISYLDEDSDALETQEIVEREGRKCIAMGGDIEDEDHCKDIIARAVKDFGKIDILVNNAAFQMSRDSLDDISSEEFDQTFRTNVYATFYLCKAAVPHMPPGGAIINTVSVNADTPKPKLIAYSATKAALQNFTGSLAQLLADKGIRANCVAPGPIWTPLIPATMPEDQVKSFGSEVPMKRAGQPAELAGIFVLLASDEASYISGATVAATGGKPIL